MGAVPGVAAWGGNPWANIRSAFSALKRAASTLRQGFGATGKLPGQVYIIGVDKSGRLGQSGGTGGGQVAQPWVVQRWRDRQGCSLTYWS
jgi:hypothetical protein